MAANVLPNEMGMMFKNNFSGIKTGEYLTHMQGIISHVTR